MRNMLRVPRADEANNLHQILQTTFTSMNKVHDLFSQVDGMDSPDAKGRKKKGLGAAQESISSNSSDDAEIKTLLAQKTALLD